MPKKLLTRSKFAALAGVTKAAITKAVNSGSIAAALVDNKTDIEHPDAAKYLDSHTRGKRSKNPVAPKPRHTPSSAEQPSASPTPHQAAKTASAHLKLAEQTKLLIRRDLVDRLFDKISSTWEAMISTGASVLALEICRELDNMNKIDAIEKIIKEHLENTISNTCKEAKGEIENF